MKPFDPRALRRRILQMSYAGASAHLGCAFSIVEILAVLYRSHLRRQADDPAWPERDYLVLSKGHGVMAQYACLNEIGWLADDELQRYFQDGTRLKGLSDAHVPGLEVSSGSLGHGLSVGVGLALAAKRRGTDQRVYAVVGDGEMNEGSMWEALLLANHAELSNLTVIVDANGFQAMGRTDEIMRLDDLAAKFTAFGFEARDVDGHDEVALDATLCELAALPSKSPRAIVARTVKGYGISFTADDNRWHYTRLTPELFATAMQELSADDASQEFATCR
ncbi:MAG: transketolase [Pirellulales bacterium]